MAVITLTGPTCAGKSTLEALLRRTGVFCNAISHTTRAPRPGEVDGQAYHFVTPRAFQALLDAGWFVEKVDFDGNRYAMSKGAIRHALDQARHVAIVVDPHGADQIQAWCEEQGIPSAAVWLDTGTETQALRFMERVATTDNLAPLVTRLASMLSDEVRWRYLASSNQISLERTYNLQLFGIDQSRSAEAVRLVTELADSL
jgi:guanylate kinase